MIEPSSFLPSGWFIFTLTFYKWLTVVAGIYLLSKYDCLGVYFMHGNLTFKLLALLL
jgi:hypothetical protein